MTWKGVTPGGIPPVEARRQGHSGKGCVSEDKLGTLFSCAALNWLVLNGQATRHSSCSPCSAAQLGGLVGRWAFPVD